MTDDDMRESLRPIVTRIAKDIRADTLEQCASDLEAVIRRGYPWPRGKTEQCEHGQFEWEGCVGCYDEELQGLADRFRALSKE